MSRNDNRKRLLIYSHDSFGLGHMRRCRAIAHSLVTNREDLSVLILSGSPIIGSFDFCGRVDYVRVPGVVKLRHGDYTSFSLDLDIEEIMSMREEIIRRTAEMFRPDVFLVDKEPLGLRGEVRDTLSMLKARGTTLILGLRDVMDEPELLAGEWERKNVLPALNDLYDQIWIYGLPDINNPLEGIAVGPNVEAKSVYTGYLRRTQTPVTGTSAPLPYDTSKPFILVSPGGGGDGDTLIDWVLRAYEQDPDIPHPALVVFGPFMHTSLQAEFRARVDRLEKVTAITFEARIEALMAEAVGVVAMGGYNLFCEILSFDKRALIVPRTVPRLEQFIRASKAENLGLLRMLEDDGVRDAGLMAQALRQLPHQKKPSDIHIPGLLDGLSTINSLVDSWVAGTAAKPAHLSLVNKAP